MTQIPDILSDMRVNGPFVQYDSHLLAILWYMGLRVSGMRGLGLSDVRWTGAYCTVEPRTPDVRYNKPKAGFVYRTFHTPEPLIPDKMSSIWVITPSITNLCSKIQNASYTGHFVRYTGIQCMRFRFMRQTCFVYRTFIVRYEGLRVKGCPVNGVELYFLITFWN